MPKALTVAETARRRRLLWALVTGFAVISFSVLTLARLQAPGADFACFWAGAKTALHAPDRLYDFDYISALQGWPLGPGRIRPYIYPPSALPFFIAFAWLPYWIGYGLWLLSTGCLFYWAGRRAGAPGWFMLLPTVALAAFCGQVTFLVGGLALLGLTLQRRPVLAGVLWGLAASVKPQLLILLPVALAARGDWKAMASTGLTGAAICAASVAILGIGPWLDWLQALGRFQRLIFGDAALTADAITPYAFLTGLNLDGAWAFLLAPLVLVAVWFTFRKPADLPDKAIALLGGALLISPYAMNYELALLAPALAAYLKRLEHPAWLIFVAASLGYIAQAPLVSLAAVLALPLAREVSERRAGRRRRGMAFAGPDAAPETTGG